MTANKPQLLLIVIVLLWCASATSCAERSNSSEGGGGNPAPATTRPPADGETLSLDWGDQIRDDRRLDSLIHLGDLIEVRARVEQRFWPFPDIESVGGRRFAILRLLDGEGIPRHPAVTKIKLTTDYIGVVRTFFIDRDIYVLLFTAQGDLYDVVDARGRSGMVDVAEAVRTLSGSE